MKRCFFALVLAATASAAGVAASPTAAIRYTYWERYDLDIWAGPTSNPIQAYGGNGGTIDVSVARNPNGTYDVLQRERDVNGAGTLKSTYGLAREGTRTLETLAAQAGTFRSGGTSKEWTDSYPDGRIGFELPLLPREGWSAATRDLSSVAIVGASPSPNSERATTESREDGTYVEHAQATDFTSTTHVRLYAASTYRLSASGYNTLNQTFELPVEGVIDVTSSGEPPLPLRPGTVKIKSWYPYNGGALTHPLLRDRFHVIGPAKIPSPCRRRVHQVATRVNEEGYDVDPVRGTASAFVTAYFLVPLSKHSALVACVVEQYVEGVWANGWAMSAGHWGKLTREQSGVRLYIAGDIPTNFGAASETSLPILGADAIAMRRILEPEFASY